MCWLAEVQPQFWLDLGAKGDPEACKKILAQP
jgi:hypothetical protein